MTLTYNSSSYKFVIQQQFEVSQKDARNVSEIIVKHGCIFQNLLLRGKFKDKEA